MPQVERQSDCKDMQNPPARFISHKIFEHFLPPEEMAEGIHCSYAQKMYYPPSGSQK